MESGLLARSCASLLASALAVTVPSIGAAQEEETGKNALDEIIVVASKIGTPRRQIGAAVSAIDSEEIELRGYISMAEVLRTQPGVAVSTSGGVGTTTSVRIRGEESFRTQAFLDGIRIADPTAPQVAPNFASLLSTNDLAVVEILRGPQGFIYGADSGGIVNIRTRRGAGPLTTRVAGEYGSFNTSRLEGAASGGTDKFDYFVSVTNAESDGFNTRPSDDVLRDDDGYRNTTLHGKFGWNVSEDLRLQFVARNADSRTDFDNCGFPRSDDCRATNDELALRAEIQHSAGRFTNLFAVSNLSTDRDNFTDGVSGFGAEGDLIRTEYTGSFELNESTRFVYGADYQEESIDSGDTDTDRGQTGVYAEYQGAFNDTLFISAGARHDDNDDFGTHTSVRVSAAYVQPLGNDASIKYRASYGTGFRAPSLFEVAYNAGPFALPPASETSLTEEQTSGYDLGIVYASDSGLLLELGWFDQDVDDAILFDLAGFSGYLQDTGKSESRGVEVAWDVPLADRWAVLGNVTWNDTENPDGDQRIRRPEWVGNLGVRFDGFDNRLRVLGNVRTANDAVDQIFGVGVVPLDDYVVVDLSGSYRVTESMEVYARLQNLFDEEYEEIADFNNGGQAVFGGVRLVF